MHEGKIIFCTLLAGKPISFLEVIVIHELVHLLMQAGRETRTWPSLQRADGTVPAELAPDFREVPQAAGDRLKEQSRLMTVATTLSQCQLSIARASICDREGYAISRPALM